MFAGNPNLQAEKSTSFTAGFVFEPNQTFSAGVSFYHIDWKNIVAAQSLQAITNIGAPCAAVPVPPCIQRDPSTGNIVTVISNYININETRTKGYDFESRITLPSAYGRFVTRFNMSYVDSFKEDLNCIGLGICSFGGLTEVAGTNYGSNAIPRIRGNVAVDWDYTRYSATAQLNYIHHYSECVSMEVKDCTIASSFFRQQDPRFQNGVMGDVHSYTTLDLYGRIKFTKNFEASASILNVFDRLPPYDPASGTNFFLASIYDVRGRQYRLGLTWRM